MMRTGAFICSVAAIFVCGCGSRQNTIIVGSKNFPEQAILGELLAQQIEAHTKMRVERRFYLAGTYICHQALLAGRIDMYVEYTGTALTAVLKEKPQNDPRAVFETVRREYMKRFHLIVEAPLGFNDSFAIVIRGADARKDHIGTISQAAHYAPAWRAGFGYEFMERPDGFDGFVKTYGLKFADAPRIMDLGLLYRALESHQVDIVAGNTTDGQLLTNDFAVLADDRHYFPPYEAVTIVRSKIAASDPKVVRAIAELSGEISDHDMQQMNYEVVGKKKDIATVAREFLQSKHLIGSAPVQ
ncbi:MAG TPA: glycine betaine ABC transporter substrate-binding protein [Candidatus Acidoferrales bacterium]|nr:glycine betaine ABC transporter substrate-binding protein [Candidatus Acidoferrales bacterium]